MKKSKAANLPDLKKLHSKMQAAVEASEKAYEAMLKNPDDEAAVEAYDEATEEFEAIEKEVEAAEALYKRRERVEAFKSTVNKTAQPNKDSVEDNGDEDENRQIGTILKSKSGGPAEPKDHKKIEKEKEDIFERFIFGDKSLQPSELKTMRPESKKWNEGKNGVLVPARYAKAMIPSIQNKPVEKVGLSSQANFSNTFDDEFKNELLRYQGEMAHLFPRTRQITTQTGTVKYPRLKQPKPTEGSGGESDFSEYGAVACEWTDEGDDKPETEPSFEQLSISTHELSARTELSWTLLSRNAINLEDVLRNEFRSAIMHKLDHAVIRGNGTGKPLGILSETDVAHVKRAVANQVGYDDLVDLEHAIAPQFRSNAMWTIADSAVGYLKKLKDTQGRPLWLPGIAGVAPATILGYPYVPTQRLKLGQEGDVIFGDPRQYICPIEQEIVIAKSEHRKIEKGVTVYVVYMLVGGRLAQTRAFAHLSDNLS